MNKYSIIKAWVARFISRFLAVSYHFFIPNQDNKGVPYVLGTRAFIIFIAIGLALIVLPAGNRYSQFALLVGDGMIDQARVVELMNSARAINGLPLLIENKTLRRSAEIKANDIFARQYFSHVAPDGTSPWEMFRTAGYQYSVAGENLAIDFVTAEEAHGAFMKSPTHRANILGRLYSEIGVAVVRGVFEGRPSIVIVQHFGTPVRAAAAAQLPPSLSMETEQKINVSVESATNPPEAFDAPIKEISQAPEKVSSSGALTNAFLSQREPHDAMALVRDVVIRVASIAVLGIVLAAFTLGIMRGAIPSWGMAARIILLFLIFGYISVVGVGQFSIGELGLGAFSIVGG